VRSPSRSPALGRASHGDTKTRRKVPARNADVLVGIIASLRFQVSGFSIFRRPSSRPDSIASLPIRIPAWICMTLGSLRWGCLMQGSDLRGGHLRNQFLTSNTAWANLFLRPSTRSGKSASDIWTYCHKSIYPEAQTGARLLNQKNS